MTTSKGRGASLGTRIFVMTAVLILLSVTAAVVVTTYLGKQITDEAIQEALAKSQSAQASFQLQRLEQLRLISQLFGSDPYFIAYLAESAASRDTLSMLDLLQDRQQELGFDFAIVLDPSGRVVVRTDAPESSGEDLSQRSLVAAALEAGQAFGVWQQGAQLYVAAAVPLVKEFVLHGFMLNGFAIDNDLAREVRNVGAAEMAYLVSTASGAQVVATTLDRDAADDLVLALRTLGALREVINRGGQHPVTIAGSPWIAQLAPLKDALDEPIGATVALVSLRKERATYRQIERVLIGVGIATILLAFGFSYALSRRAMRPVRDLAQAAAAARRGDYAHGIDPKRSDEVGQLARTFNELLAELREKQDMQSYVASLSRSLPEPATQKVLSSPQAAEVALLGVELRRLAHPRLTQDPEATLERLSRDLRRAKSAITGARGSFSYHGHRVVGVFQGAERSFQALRAATRIMQSLGQRESAFDEVEPPAAAITSGEALLGSLVVSEQPERTVVGTPVQQLESLLREATPGDILLSQECYRQLEDVIGRSGFQLSAQRGLMSTQPIFLLSADMGAQVTGDEGDGRTAILEPAVGGGTTLSDFGPGTVLGNRYEILAVLGAGGMGVVYKARDRELNDLVALKMLRQVGVRPMELDGLKNELKLARRITHPNVLRTFDFGEIDGVPFISMEYVRGLTLRYLLDQTGRLPFAAGLRLAKQLCAGLGAAHAERVMHRDIKPENIILDAAGDAKIMDFGIAQPVAPRGTGGTTAVDMIVGTPHYLAPEQLRGQVPDTRADIYACGMVIYEMFTGRLAFAGGNPAEIVHQHLSRDPTPPSTYWTAIPKRLEAIILRCLAKEPSARFASVQELAAELDTVTAA